MNSRPCREGDRVVRMVCRCDGSIFVLASAAPDRGHCGSCRGAFRAVGAPIELGPGGSHPTPPSPAAVATACAP